MMRKIMYILMMGIIILLSSCVRRPLVDLSNTHYVRVYVDEELLNVTTGFYNEEYQRPYYASPDVLRIILADPETGEARAERFLRNKGCDEKGNYFDGYIVAAPGEYALLAYNFDTESLMIQNINNWYDITATSIEIAPHLKTRIPSRATKTTPSDDSKASEDVKAPEEYEKIVFGPDHLFSANCGNVYVPYRETVDTLRTPEGEYFYAESIVKSYYLQVRVQGLRFASSSVGLMTGMAGSSYVNGYGMNTDDNVTVYFEMINDKMSGDETAEDITTIYTTFSTFGKIPSAGNELEITFDFLTIYGKPYSEAIDITELFNTKEAIENQWLLIDHTIVIPEPPKVEPGSGGGIMPGVDDWEDIETDILI